MDRAKLKASIACSSQFTPTRKVSLYSNFSRLEESNPDGFEANVTAWRAVLLDALSAGAFEDSTALEAGPQLLRALSDPQSGIPMSLDTVIETMVRDGSLIPSPWFTVNSNYPVLSQSWRPGAVLKGVCTWAVGHVLDIQWHAAVAGELRHAKYIALGPLRQQSCALLDALIAEQGVTCRKAWSVCDIENFAVSVDSLKGFSKFDVECCLLYLSRETRQITFDRSRGAVKLPKVKGARPDALTPEDYSILDLERQGRHIALRATSLAVQIDKAKAEARAAIKQGNRLSAKRWLAQSSTLERAQEHALALGAQLDSVIARIEAATTNQATLAVLEQSSDLLNKLNSERTPGSAESVDKLLNDLQDSMADTDAVTAELAGLGLEGKEVDVEAELENLEREVEDSETGSKLDKLPPAPDEIKQANTPSPSSKEEAEVQDREAILQEI